MERRGGDEREGEGNESRNTPSINSCVRPCLGSLRPCLGTPLPRYAPALVRPCLGTPLPRYAPASVRPCLGTPLPRYAPASVAYTPLPLITAFDVVLKSGHD